MGVAAVLVDDGGRERRGLADPAGGTFDAAGDFDRLLGDRELANLQVWTTIDVDGDTELSHDEAAQLLQELPDVFARSRQGPERRGLMRLQAICELCAASSRLGVRFIGD